MVINSRITNKNCYKIWILTEKVRVEKSWRDQKVVVEEINLPTCVENLYHEFMIQPHAYWRRKWLISSNIFGALINTVILDGSMKPQSIQRNKTLDKLVQYRPWSVPIWVSPLQRPYQYLLYPIPRPAIRASQLQSSQTLYLLPMILYYFSRTIWISVGIHWS